MAISRLSQLSMQLRNAEDQEREQNGPAESSYKVNEQPLRTASKICIITIGAGASGLNVIRTLRKHLTNYEHVIYEKTPKVGGTWYENRYPGCKCDIQSHNYQFSWKPNREWSSSFSPAEEIETYLCHLYAEEDMQNHVTLEHEVVGAYWKENSGHWKVKIKNLKTGNSFEDHCEFVLNASGVPKGVNLQFTLVWPDYGALVEDSKADMGDHASHWQWPEISGLHEFSGTLVHSANWTEGFD